MSGDLSQHHLSFTSSYVLVHNHARVDVFTITSFPSLSLIGIAGGTQQPWNYLNEPVWSLNVKRGILSAVQNSMRDSAASELVFETDVVGHCETNYNLQSVGRNGVIVSRSKDLMACTGRNGQHSAPILSTPYSSASSIQSLLRSENEYQQTIRNQLLEKSVCTETHLFRPFSSGQSGASIRIIQTLTYNSEGRSDQISTVQESQIGISPKTPALFPRLVTALRSLSYSQLSELFGKAQNF